MKIKKNIFIVLGAFGLGLLAIILALFLRSIRLSQQLTHSREAIQKMQEEIARVDSERKKVITDNEKLQSEAVDYVELNTKLQDERDKLQNSVEESGKIIKVKETDLGKLKQRLSDVEKEIILKSKSQQEKLLKERAEIENKIASADSTLQKERSLYHYNLGVAYTRARLYDEAVAEYEKSLNFGPNNPDTHYNLGLLYENFKEDPDKAVAHYHKYLELMPEAEDKEEVKAWIVKLSK